MTMNCWYGQARIVSYANNVQKFPKTIYIVFNSFMHTDISLCLLWPQIHFYLYLHFAICVSAFQFIYISRRLLHIKILWYVVKPIFLQDVRGTNAIGKHAQASRRARTLASEINLGQTLFDKSFN